MEPFEEMPSSPTDSSALVTMAELAARREFFLFARWLLCNPHRFADIRYPLLGVYGKIRRRLSRKRANDARKTDPPYLDRQAAVLSENGGGIKFDPELALRLEPEAVQVERIRLASLWLPVNGEPDWQLSFPDQEDLFAFHRFGWGLELLNRLPFRSVAEWVVKAFLSWQHTMGQRKEHPAWESYSVAERIVHLIQLVQLTGEAFWQDEAAQRWLQDTLHGWGEHLACHLEYRGEETNNHLLNNARALYLLGAVAGDASFAEVGRQLLTHELSRQISPSGFLREGSSHYQLLLTRSVLEICWAARLAGDLVFFETIQRYGTAMLAGCAFFRIDGAPGFPLVGDISPDCPPSWVAGLLPQVGEVSENQTVCSLPGGWQQLFGKSHSISATSPAVPRTCYPEDGWYRFEHDGAVLLVFAPQEEILLPHAHNDLFSFCLYLQGEPVIIDSGRLQYGRSPLSRAGRSACAHSALLVDGCEIQPLDWLRLFSPDYLARRVRVRPLSQDKGLEIDVRTGERLRGIDGVRRTFLLENGRLRIRDELAGKKRVRQTFFFHVDRRANVTCAEGEVLLRVGTQCVRFAGASESRMKIRGLPGIQAVGYGEAVSNFCMMIETEASLPCCHEWTFSWR